MFRLFDVLVLISSLSTLILSIYLFVYNGLDLSLITGLYGLFILALGIYIKLLRIVHFVLYKNFEGHTTSHGESNG